MMILSNIRESLNEGRHKYMKRRHWLYEDYAGVTLKICTNSVTINAKMNNLMFLQIISGLQLFSHGSHGL
jgi:hypothetical protein